jgi:plasmid stabilization system protein ParE
MSGRRRVIVTPQARQDLQAISSWYRHHMGKSSALKVSRSLRAGLTNVSITSLAPAAREDLPEGYFRVVAKSHLIVFRMEQDVARVIRVIHASRDVVAALEEIDEL